MEFLKQWMNNTQNEKNPDDNEKPIVICYKALIVMLFFTFKQVGQWHTF